MNIILYGNDDNRMKQKIESLKKKHHIDYILSFDATKDDQADVLHEMDSMSIFDEEKMIVIEKATFLSAKNTTSYEIEDFIRRSDNASCIVIFCCPAQKLDGRKKAVKQMQEVSTVIPCMALDEKSLPGVINEMAQKVGVSLDSGAYQYIVQNIGMDPLIIENEMEKLKTYSDTITYEDAVALVHPQPTEDVFKMVNALFDRKAIAFLQYYRSFRQQGMEPVAVVGLLAGQIRFLYQVRVQMDLGYGQDEIASHLKAHPYRVKMNMQRAWNYMPQDLLDQLEELSDFDQNMKKGLVDKDQGFEQWIFKRMMES